MDIFREAKILTEEPIGGMLTKQKSITRLFPPFYARVKAVGAAGGIKLIGEKPGLWHFDVASATTPGKSYDIFVEFSDIEDQIKKHTKNMKLWKADKSGVDLRKLAGEIVKDSDMKILCSCPAFQYWGPAYITTKRGSKYGEPETRPPKKRNPKEYGLGCKHSQQMFDVMPFYKVTMAGHLRRYFAKDVKAAEDEMKKEVAAIKKGAAFLGGKQPSESVREASEEDQVKHFEERTKRHIDLVKKAAAKIAQTDIVDGDELMSRVEKHDQSKLEEPERTPYIAITWRHKMENEQGKYDPFNGKGYQTPGLLTKEDENKATMHHITSNEHHPEYWNKEQANIDPANRDKSIKAIPVPEMTPLAIAEMVADWQAMSEELGTNTAREWFEKQKNVRWTFTAEQEDLIDRLLKVFEQQSSESVLEGIDPKKLGQCFVLSGRYVLDSTDADVRLVHGTITRKHDGYTMDHAWVEKGDNVIDPVLEWDLPKDAYYGMLDAKPKKVYDKDEMIKAMMKVKHWGPWESISEQQLYEIFKQYTYKPNREDKEMLMLDFYVLNALPMTGNEDLDIALEDSRKAINSYLREHQLEAVYFAICCEFRHIFDRNSGSTVMEWAKNRGPETVQFFKAYYPYFSLKASDKGMFLDRPRTPRKYSEDEKARRASYEAVNKATKDRDFFVDLAEDAFNSVGSPHLSWSGSFGGGPWANICKGWKSLEEAEEKDLPIWIDHVYDLQHNTSTVFNKLKSYYKSGYDWIKRALDFKFKATNMYEFFDKISPGLASFASAVIKADKGTTFEQWLKDKEKPKPEKEEKTQPVGKEVPGGFHVGDKVKYIGGAKTSHTGKEATVIGDAGNYVMIEFIDDKEKYNANPKNLDIVKAAEPKTGFEKGTKVSYIGPKKSIIKLIGKGKHGTTTGEFVTSMSGKPKVVVVDDKGNTFKVFKYNLKVIEEPKKDIIKDIDKEFGDTKGVEDSAGNMLKVGDHIEMTEPANKAYGVTKAGSQGEINNIASDGKVQAKFYKATGSAYTSTDLDFVVDPAHAKKIAPPAEGALHGGFKVGDKVEYTGDNPYYKGKQGVVVNTSPTAAKIGAVNVQFDPKEEDDPYDAVFVNLKKIDDAGFKVGDKVEYTGGEKDDPYYKKGDTGTITHIYSDKKTALVQWDGGIQLGVHIADLKKVSDTSEDIGVGDTVYFTGMGHSITSNPNVGKKAKVKVKAPGSGDLVIRFEGDDPEEYGIKKEEISQALKKIGAPIGDYKVGDKVVQTAKVGGAEGEVFNSVGHGYWVKWDLGGVSSMGKGAIKPAPQWPGGFKEGDKVKILGTSMPWAEGKTAIVQAYDSMHAGNGEIMVQFEDGVKAAIKPLHLMPFIDKHQTTSSTGVVKDIKGNVLSVGDTVEVVEDPGYDYSKKGSQGVIKTITGPYALEVDFYKLTGEKSNETEFVVAAHEVEKIKDLIPKKEHVKGKYTQTKRAGGFKIGDKVKYTGTKVKAIVDDDGTIKYFKPDNLSLAGVWWEKAKGVKWVSLKNLEKI